jgi:hypothetical protein
MYLTDIYRAGFNGEQAGRWPRSPHKTGIKSTDFDTFPSSIITKIYFVFSVISGNKVEGEGIIVTKNLLLPIGASTF